MNKYNEGKIYKLTSSETNKIYIGSTCNTLYKRFSSHKANSKNESKKAKSCKSNEMFKYADIKIELIENFSCETKAELLKREDEIIRQFRDIAVNVNIAINVNMPIRDEEKLKKYMAEYNKKHYYNHHEEQLKRSEEYRHANNDKVKESQKAWRDINKEAEAERNAKYFAEHKAELQAKHKARDVIVECSQCKQQLKKYSLPRHIRLIHYE